MAIWTDEQKGRAMDVSKRLRGIIGDGSDGWDLFLKARRLKAAGKPVIELTVGQHDIATDPLILDAMNRSARAGHTGYAALPGTDSLRDAVARRVESHTGVPTTRANVLITPGGQSALFVAHMAALDPGDTTLFIDPYYATYPGTIRAASGVPRAVPAFADNGFQPDPADIDAAAPGARALLINSPNNPTGAIYDPDTQDGIAGVAKKHGLWLISDEVYESQIWTGTHRSMRTLKGMADQTFVVSSMSKTFAMTGSRIGWLVGPEHAIARAADLSTQTTYGVPGFIQDAAEFALGLGADFEAKLAEPFRRRQRIALELLSQQNVLSAVPSDGTMYVMLDIRATGLTGEAFAHALLDSCNIAVMPGESFGAQAAGHVRVAMTIADELFATSMSTLIDFANGLAHA
jgi:arginine:pyruvate transaminase